MTPDNLVEIAEGMPHKVMETICVSCLNRSITAFPAHLWLKDLECGSCGKTGYLISTGQALNK